MSSVFKLIIEDDAGRQIVVPFARDQISIGRKEGNTIRLTERNVSRKHALLSRENSHVVLEDLGSFNGIKLNGDRIEGRVAINEGDTIQIGDYHLALHVQESPDGADGSGDGSEDDGTGGGGPDDQFAGDTQRWVASSGKSEDTAQGLATQEERPASAAGLLGLTSASPTSMERPDVGGSLGNHGASDLDAAHAEFEATQRQPVAPVATSSPSGSTSKPMPTPALGRPASATSGAATHGATTNGDIAVRPAPAPAMHAPGAAARSATVRSPGPEVTESMPSAPAQVEDLRIPRLVVLNSVFAGSTFTLRGTEMVIGRTSDNDITIEHKSVSRNHAKIVREGDRVRIVDLKSANGVLVNDDEVDNAVLRSGDVIELGRVRIRFVPVGEKFELSPQEKERARLADINADDFEADGSTGITNPIRPKPDLGKVMGSAPVASPWSKTPLVMLGAVAVGLLLVGAFLVVRGPEPASTGTAPDGAPAPPSGEPADRNAAPPADGAPAGSAAPSAPAPEAGSPQGVPAEAGKATAAQPADAASSTQGRADEKRPPKGVLDAYKSEGLKAFLRADWREAADLLGSYQKWVKDDRVVNDNLKKAQERLGR